MKNVKKVLACIDFSNYSREVLDYAFTVSPPAAEIVALNVINNRDLVAIRSVSSFFPSDGEDVVEQYINKNMAVRKKQLVKLVEEHFALQASRIRMQVSVGVPFEEILKVIKAESIDLVVLASKGRTDVPSVLFGSTAEKIFRHSPVPVLSVRNRQAGIVRDTVLS